MMKKFKTLFVIFGTLLLIIYFQGVDVLAEGGESIRVYSTEDTCIRSDIPEQIKGNETTLTVWHEFTSDYRAYLKMDLRHLPQGSIKSAILHITSYSYAPNFSVEVWGASDDWTEEITWLNKPILGEKLGSLYISKKEEYEDRTLNVTEFVNREKLGDGMATFCLWIPGVTPSKYTYFQSRESGSPPYLEIQFEEYVNRPPLANFKWIPEISEVNLEINFLDLSFDPDGTITNWKWHFGDGSTSSERNPTHTYLVAGNYTVTLEVIDSGGALDKIVKTMEVLSKKIPPGKLPWYNQPIWIALLVITALLIGGVAGFKFGLTKICSKHVK